MPSLEEERNTADINSVCMNQGEREGFIYTIGLLFRTLS